jgi:hypothetical protein
VLFLMLCSSGMFIASSALLPSSFAMYLVTLATSELVAMGVPDARDFERMRTTVCGMSAPHVSKLCLAVWLAWLEWICS